MNDSERKAVSHAMLNAARISHEYTLIEGRDFLHAAGAIDSAARMLADIETAPGFRWNEGSRGDWETCCARIARHIRDGDALALSADVVRRLAV